MLFPRPCFEYQYGSFTFPADQSLRLWGMEMAQMRQWVENITPEIARPHLLNAFLALLNNPPHKYITA